MSEAFDALTAEVAETKGAVNSLITLVQGLSAYIKANAADEQAMLDLAASLDADQAEITAAVAANPVPGDTPPVA